MVDLCVVGGGAAGLLCAAIAAEAGSRVVVAEKMPRPGRKLLITGKGRCNVCNDCTRDEFIDAVRQNGKFLYSAYSAFPSNRVMELFTRLGVPLKTERGKRVFPRSDRAADIVDALVTYAQRCGAGIVQAECARLNLADGRVTGITTGDGGAIRADKVAVATGGMSYPLTGSTGDGYRLARETGHTVTELKPSLIPIVAAEDWCRNVMGLPLKNIGLRVVESVHHKIVFSQQGELLFTHFGVSGPLVLSASAHMRKKPGQYRLEIDLKPALSPERLDARLLRDFNAASNRNYLNSLGELLPRKLIPVIVRLSGIPGDTKVHQITKEQRHALCGLIKCLPLTPVGFRPIEEAVITAGGVKVSEVNPKTMESKLVRGLYFAGEVLDVDAYTGGFNLQIAFSTGYLAGRSAAQK